MENDLSQVNTSIIHEVPIKDLKPRPNNRNKHPKEQIERLAKIIEYQGFRRPVVVSLRSGYVVCGHGRIEAAKKLKFKTVPVIYQNYESEEQEYADHVADNSLQYWAELDLSGINSDMLDLGPELDLDMLGIKDFVLEPSEKFQPQCDEDEVPEYVEPKTKLGDIYQLGRHRLMCGDSTSIDAVEKLMNGEKADMVFTDPPYGVSYEDSKGRKIQNDNLTDGDLQEFLRSAFVCSVAVSKQDAAWYVWHASRFQREFENALNDSAVKVRQQIIWVKGEGVDGTAQVKAPAIGRSDFRWLHEPCFYASRGSPFNSRDRKTTTVWTVTRQTKGTVHPTQKPVDLIKIALDNSCPSGGIVLDLFGGSGSTMIACDSQGMSARLMELDPHYCDVIVARWEKFTGQKAALLTP